MKPALFIDRDGTLNYDCPYCKNISEIRIYEDIFDPIKLLSKNYYIIIVTNQSGIAKGIFSVIDLEKMNKKIKDSIESRGGRVDRIYYCPHKNEDKCECRKPNIGMVYDALREFSIDLDKSFVIGDDDKDIMFARNAGIKSIRIRRQGTINGDYFAEDFYDVVSIISKSTRNVK